MNRKEIFEKISKELFLQYEKEINETYSSQEEFFESLKDLFYLFAEKYNSEKHKSFEQYIKNSLEEDILSTLGLIDPEIDELETFNEEEQRIIITLNTGECFFIGSSELKSCVKVEADTNIREIFEKGDV